MGPDAWPVRLFAVISRFDAPVSNQPAHCESAPISDGPRPAFGIPFLLWPFSQSISLTVADPIWAL
jgi:hypothetical protein